MDREIKFKFVVERDGIKHLSDAYEFGEEGLPSYDTVLEEMNGGCNCGLNESDAFCDGSCDEWENATVIGKVQYIGKEDKNGTEIYEGNDVKFLNRKNEPLIYEVRYFRHKMMPFSSNMYMPCECEVVSNIHNPELQVGA